MSWLFDTIKGRVLALLVLFFSLSHVIGLWLYVQKNEEATTLLHDALLAEQVALLSRLSDRLRPEERSAMFEGLSGPMLRLSQIAPAAQRPSVPEEPRAHVLEHLLAVFLDRPTHENIHLSYLPASQVSGLANLLGTIRASAHGTHHLPGTPLTEIRALGAISADVALSDGSWVRFTSPLLTVTPFSALKLGAPLAVMLGSVLVIAAWLLHQWTQPLNRFAAAAERLGTDIAAPALVERGPSEVRLATRALNVMQERVRRLVEDRTAFAAAIAHDLGTPITRLHLRANEIADDTARAWILSDLEQMRCMITATLEFARLDFSAEPSEVIDLASLLESLCHDLADAGQSVMLEHVQSIHITSKPTTLRRALSNIIDNAVKYGGCARVHVEASSGEVRIHVTDNGPGIPEHLLDTAFRPFQRLGPSDNPIRGTGLGLSIARSNVRGLGGDILLINRPKGGLQVTVLLPLSKVRMPTAT